MTGTSHPPPGEALADFEELLLRNARAEFVHAGQPSKQVFEPASDDGGLLSMDRGSLSSPQETFERFISTGVKSVGVLAVSVGECHTAGVPALRNELPSNSAHAVADYRAHANKQTKKRAGQLRDGAVARGWKIGPKGQ